MHKDLEFPSEKVNTSMLYLGQGQIEPESYTSNAEEEEAWQAVEKRMNIIGHNGATGAHYGEPMDDNCPAARDGQDSVAVVNKASTGEYEFYPSSNLVDIPNGMHKLYTHPASAEVERLQAQVVELVAVAVSVRDDLLLRSEIDSDGTRCVNLSASKWSSFCDVIDDNNSEAFILRKQAEAVQASRRKTTHPRR